MRSVALALLLFSLSRSGRAATDLHQAEADVLQGRADRAIAELQATLSQDSGNGPAHLLLCRAFLSKLSSGDAAEQCRLAVEGSLARDSAAQDWAGRAFGLRAQHAGPIAGLKLAGEVRNAFQAAFHLDPRNPAGASDLGEFYIDAPFLVGGGVDKAKALADTLQPTLPETSHRLRALIAEKREDFATAEREFIAATQVAQAAGAFVDLANFYVRQSAAAKAIAAARKAIALDRAVDANVVDAAMALKDAHQGAEAAAALRSYLNHGHLSDQAPAFRVHTFLGEILAASGDKAGARREFQAALSLAAGYAPAQKDLGAL